MSPSIARLLPLLATGAVLLAAGAGLYSCTRGSSADRLTDAEAVAAQPGAENLMVGETQAQAVDPVARCGSGASHAALKQALFRRAAEIRGRDEGLFQQIASAASLRVDRPAVLSEDEGLGSIACAASVALDLPAGFGIAGGQGNLIGNLTYTLSPKAGAAGDGVELTSADGIVVPLATLARLAPPVSERMQVEPADPLGPEPGSGPPTRSAPSQPRHIVIPQDPLAPSDGSDPQDAPSSN